jgi:hypothetical protein
LLDLIKGGTSTGSEKFAGTDSQSTRPQSVAR